MARASYPTLLSLDRFAQILGIAPPHFNGAASAATGDNPFPLVGCGDIWWQFQWQSHDRVSREEIALAIMNAEEDIANVLGFYPAPKYIEEVHMFPRHHRRDLFDSGLNLRGMRKSVRLKWGKMIQQGQRNVDFIGEATVLGGTLTYSDPDGDGYDELATIVLPTAYTEPCEIKTYFDGYSTPEWEIRPPRTIVIAGGNVTITFWSWQLIDPTLWEAFPTAASPEALNLLDAAIYVDTVDVYREFPDITVASSRFYWEPEVENLIPAMCTVCGGAGCPTCSLTYQDGCLYVRNVDEGLAVPVPADYDDDEEAWLEQTWLVCREPDQVKVWYYAGDINPLYLQHATPTGARRRCDMLSDYYAEAIAYLATARLDRNFCSCKQVQAKVEYLRMNLIESVPNGPTFVVDDDVLSNPFGTRMGEVLAWRRLGRLVKRRAQVAVI